METVTVVVPVYNAERHLEKCVDSILNQTYRNLEVLLIDDESTDQSGRLCEKFQKADSRVKVIHKKNGGAGSARNAGIDLAKGKYLLFVDSDDYLDEKLIRKAVYLAEEEKADMVLFDYMEVDASHAIFEVEVPREWIGKTVGGLDIRRKYDINILAVKNEREVSIAVSPNTVLIAGSTILVLGDHKAIQKCFHI